MLTNDMTQLLVYSSCTSEAQLIDYVLSRVAHSLNLLPSADETLKACKCIFCATIYSHKCDIIT